MVFCLNINCSTLMLEGNFPAFQLVVCTFILSSSFGKTFWVWDVCKTDPCAAERIAFSCVETLSHQLLHLRMQIFPSTVTSYNPFHITPFITIIVAFYQFQIILSLSKLYSSGPFNTRLLWFLGAIPTVHLSDSPQHLMRTLIIWAISRSIL